MLDMIIMGLKDIKNNVYVFIIILFSVFITSVIAIASTLSLVEAINLYGPSNLTTSNYLVTPISTEIIDIEPLSNKTYLLINEYGNSYFSSMGLSEIFSVPVYIQVGKEYDQRNGSSEQLTTIYVTAGILDDVINKNYDFPEQVNYKPIDYEFIDEQIEHQINYPIPGEQEAIVIQLNTQSVSQWIDQIHGDELMDLITNANFKTATNSSSIEQEFLSYFQNKYINVQKKNTSDDEASFILRYIYVILILMVVIIALSMRVIFQYTLKKMYREYSIHMLSGAAVSDIIIRNTIFVIGVTLLPYLGILLINQFKWDLPQLIGTLTILIVFVVLEIMLFSVITNKSLNINLREVDWL